MNFAPIWIEDMSSIRNEIQTLKTTWRTGGNVANAYRPFGKGYNYDLKTDVLGKWFKSPNFGLTYFRQQSWEKNWIEVLGEMIAGKDLIYVCNIYQSVSESLLAINMFKNQYGCNIVGVELGNENYLKLYRMTLNEYLKRCEPFLEQFKDGYKVIYQVTDKPGFKNKEWDSEVSKIAPYKAVHVYPDELVDPIELIDRIIDEHGNNIMITEWNLKQANQKYTIEVWSDWVGKFKSYADSKGIINCYHNHLSPILGAWVDLNTPREEIIKLFK